MFSPEFAERAAGWLDRVATHARATAVLPYRLCHGDFKYAQVFFDGAAVGLVDLDNVCQAEPALDLGQFTAYLRTQMRKTERDASVPATLEHELCERFFADYAAAMALGAEDAQALRARSALHEVVSLVRVAAHSQQKLKQARLDSASELIEERLGGLA
jgi:aminoglycoside phosphotransferase (APT) family kinase protein